MKSIRDELDTLREENESLKRVYNQLFDACKSEQAHAKTAEARVKELEKALEEGNKEWEKLCWSAQDKYADCKAKLSRYESALKKILIYSTDCPPNYSYYAWMVEIAKDALLEGDV